MIKLYGFQQSRSFRALWALEESGLKYQYVGVKLRTDADVPDSATNPKYLAVNVQGKVPTLVDGELTLTESVAILYYIARSAPESGLLPNASMDVYARIDELACFVLAELEQPLWSKGKHMFALPEEYRIPQMLETAKFEFAKALGALDHLLDDLEKSRFAIGGSFSPGGHSACPDFQLGAAIRIRPAATLYRLPRPFVPTPRLPAGAGSYGLIFPHDAVSQQDTTPDSGGTRVAQAGMGGFELAGSDSGLAGSIRRGPKPCI